ncbi:7769_t:CDS:2 [Paraglomus brasilianum]|uniref:7769_t:CDS:1 n=1 Tax=Paraglomus brasilianum TaxID=144538 RepID=A0A9N9A7M9_9GLOM|nr:7769_t:CDS:2 [Paraglomus brasilianum]
MAKHGSLLSRLQHLDAYAKTLDDFRVKTYYGAALTIISAFIILYLLLSEFADYRTPEMRTELIVDKGRKAKLTINVNITFPKIPCYLLSVDVLDAAGEVHNDLAHEVHKTRLDTSGAIIGVEMVKELGDSTKSFEKLVPNKNTTGTNETDADKTYCGKCYGGEPPESGCCNTCDDVKEAYVKKGWSFNNPEGVEQCINEGWIEKIQKQSKEGCNLAGSVRVKKVAGNFHFAPGKSFERNHVHVHDIQPFLSDDIKHEFTHIIHHMSYGPFVESVVNPLDGTSKIVDSGNFQFQYFLKVVATQFHYLNGDSVYTNQFSVTEYERNLSQKQDNSKAYMHNKHGGLPGVFFYYDISPMLIINREHQKSFTHFMTGICAIVGGIFTVAGILDGFIYSAEKTLKKKIELGKHL